MTREEMQEIIENPHPTPVKMRMIAESYLRGDVLKDLIAAEAWLSKVIQSEDRKEAFLAMVLLGKYITKKEQVVSDKDYKAILEDYEKSFGEEKEQLEYYVNTLQSYCSPCE